MTRRRSRLSLPGPYRQFRGNCEPDSGGGFGACVEHHAYAATARLSASPRKSVAEAGALWLRWGSQCELAVKQATRCEWPLEKGWRVAAKPNRGHSRAERAKRADGRGRRVGSSVIDYERLAGRGPKRMAEALLARHNVRMTNLMQLPTEYRVGAIESLGPISLLDAAHQSLGIPLVRTPVLQTGSWPRDLAWGVDSAVAAVRLLLAGQVVGAATIARQQLELWTLVLARVSGCTRDAGESFTNFVARSWTEFLSRSPDSVCKMPDLTEPVEVVALDEMAAADEPEIRHDHLALSDGSEVCPALVYSVLSEIMHARECEDVTTWESKGLLDPQQLPEAWFVPIGAVSDAISLSLIQIGMMTAAAVAHNGDHGRAALLAQYWKWPHRFSSRDPESDAREFWSPPSELIPADRWRPRPQEPVIPSLVSLMPLTPIEGLKPQHVAYLDKQHWTYASMRGGFRPAGRLYRDDELVTLTFDAHRFSAVQLAVNGLRMEAQKFGASFDARSVAGRGSFYVLVSEIAALTSTWCGGTISAALRLISSSLRSAYWLWLEDDDRAMASLRCTLEQAARIAATLKNPHRARGMENRPTLPSRWLEAAGWKRLKVLNDALGEYSHAQKKLDPVRPRLLLSALQMDSDENPDAIYTARRHALDLVSEFAARSTIDVLRTTSHTIAESTVQMLDTHGPFDLSDQRKERVLDHAWGLHIRAENPPNPDDEISSDHNPSGLSC